MGMFNIEGHLEEEKEEVPEKNADVPQEKDFIEMVEKEWAEYQKKVAENPDYDGFVPLDPEVLKETLREEERMFRKDDNIDEIPPDVNMDLDWDIEEIPPDIPPEEANDDILDTLPDVNFDDEDEILPDKTNSDFRDIPPDMSLEDGEKNVEEDPSKKEEKDLKSVLESKETTDLREVSPEHKTTSSLKETLNELGTRVLPGDQNNKANENGYTVNSSNATLTVTPPQIHTTNSPKYSLKEEAVNSNISISVVNNKFER